jgi:hypothetical protein
MIQEKARGSQPEAETSLKTLVLCKINHKVFPANHRPRTTTLEYGLMFKVASWNSNSVRSRLTHVTAWLKVREPDALLLQELKGTEFPFEAFRSLGYESAAVTQKAYNGVAILSRHR